MKQNAWLRSIYILIAILLIPTTWHFSKAAFASRSRAALADILDPVPTARGISGRRLVRFGDQACIVLRHPLMHLASIPSFNDSVDGERLELSELPKTSRWYVPPSRIEQLTTFNCASFALGETIGLSTSDWLECYAASTTNHQCPVTIILNHFYDLVVAYPSSDLDWTEFATLELIRANDIVVMLDQGSDNQIEYAHLGKIVKSDGRNLMISKMGTGPIVQGSVQRTASEFAGAFNKLRVYRRKQP